jgi:dTDP-4-dehydrorhamnose reductase
MKIAITGSGGQLGSELCRRLGEAALPLDVPEFDLTDRERVRSILVAQRPTAVINTAAYTQVDRAEQDAERCWKINSEGVGYLAKACGELDCPLVQISTDYVFGIDTTRSTPYREQDEPGPQGVYAQSKLGGERQAAPWARHLIVRTCGLYGQPGPKTPGGNFVNTMLRLGRERNHLRVVDDQHCAPSYVPHVADAILFLLKTEARGTFHVVNTGATTWHGFAAEIFRLAVMPVTLERITTAQYGAPAPRPGYSLLDTSKYHALAGPPMPIWQEALAEYLGTLGIVSPTD